jgi:hypothetical protein
VGGEGRGREYREKQTGEKPVFGWLFLDRNNYSNYD